MLHKLLLVDDESKVLDFMQSFLSLEGFEVLTAQNGIDALNLAKMKKPDLVILDWMMPGMNGIEVCRELRKMGPIGIIMVTAKSEEVDKIIGLEVGADDYITKPFSLRELSARIRSVLRRMDSSIAMNHSETIEWKGLTISEEKRKVLKKGIEVALTPKEFKILLTLATRPGVVYSRLQLLRTALDDEYMNDERTIDAHISHIRKKIEDDPSSPTYIQTVFGFGYRFGDE
ncbi:response regulator transcription factor [Bacillus horti]|uniref:DNA-binding response OmpR family regulator n=1 Tax=Caldalkalibacillus horti TaxID=77523 RepID=A0ABT9VZY3_9BACI|nr:response regulator transcription factor [Bacillus horti]MDQ0166527.1 DNA-binding response OmpR family regulator [Bacillus horti]